MPSPRSRARSGPSTHPRATPTASAVRETTDETVRIVTVGGGQSSSKTCYHACHHGEPACGITPTKGESRPWSIEQARVWRDPCSYCFPDGDGHDDEAEHRDTDGAEAGDRA
jgi:hypothetical protein